MTDTNLTALIGYVAAAVGSFMMLPQVVKSARTRRVDELSLGMIWLYVINCALWEVYGVRIGSGPMELANAVGLTIALAQLGLKLAYE